MNAADRRDWVSFSLGVALLLFGAVILSVLFTSCSSTALADPGQASSRGADRCYGKNCIVKTLTVTSATNSITVPAGGKICLNVACTVYLNSSGTDWQLIGPAAQLYSGGGSAYIRTAVPFQGADGTAGTPAWGFANDTNTGFFSSGADLVSLSTGGVESLRFRLTGYISSPGLNTNLVLDNTNAQLTHGSGSNVTAGNGQATVSGTTLNLTQGANGARYSTSTATTAFAGTAATWEVDGNTGRAYWQETATLANSPLYDLGGMPHPVLQRRTYVVDVGTESTSSPTWQVAPRTGGSTATVSVVDAAAATATTFGSAPYVFDARGSVTLAAAASTSTVITANAGIKASRGPRWCQRVNLSALTTVRVFAGMTPSLPGASDTLANSSAAFRFSTNAADAKWMACTKDGATQSCTDTTIAPSTTALQTLCIDCREAAACTFWIDGVARVRKTTNLPVAGTNMNVFWTVEALAASARTLAVSSASVEFN